MSTVLAPRRRRDEMEPVVELETAPMDVSMDVVEAEPDKRGAEDGGESQGDDEVCRRHC
tara:strand:+ start:17887 stop:18063 length:177 start_codon:yes stop_codon:yes gene_type:complete